MSSIIADAAKAAHTGTDRGLQEVLDFLVTQEQLSVTFQLEEYSVSTCVRVREGAQDPTAYCDL